MLKLREGAYVAAEPYETEQLLHGYLAAVDESVRAFVLEGQGRAADRAHAAAAALEQLGADVTLVPTRHPVVDIVQFQLLTVDLAEHRGADPTHDRRPRRNTAASTPTASVATTSAGPRRGGCARPPRLRVRRVLWREQLLDGVLAVERSALRTKPLELALAKCRAEGTPPSSRFTSRTNVLRALRWPARCESAA